MLADTIVNAVRRRLLPAADRVRADKWRKAVKSRGLAHHADPARRAVPDLRLQHHARAPPARTDGAWLPAKDGTSLGQAVANLRGTAPEGGTSLEAAFAAAAAMRPPPDNIIVLTDGLPTQGLTPPRGAPCPAATASSSSTARCARSRAACP
jgi:hypothetical protein